MEEPVITVGLTPGSRVMQATMHPPDRTPGGLLRRTCVVRQLHELAPSFAIQLAEPRAPARIAHDDEAPALAVAPARRTDGGVHDPAEQRLGNRIRLEASHGALRGDGVEEIHDPVPPYAPNSRSRNAGASRSAPAGVYFDTGTRRSIHGFIAQH